MYYGMTEEQVTAVIDAVNSFKGNHAQGRNRYLNYNGWQDTLVCLDSLQKQTIQGR